MSTSYLKKHAEHQTSDGDIILTIRLVYFRDWYSNPTEQLDIHTLRAQLLALKMVHPQSENTTLYIRSSTKNPVYEFFWRTNERKYVLLNQAKRLYDGIRDSNVKPEYQKLGIENVEMEITPVNRTEDRKPTLSELNRVSHRPSATEFTIDRDEEPVRRKRFREDEEDQPPIVVRVKYSLQENLSQLSQDDLAYRVRKDLDKLDMIKPASSTILPKREVSYDSDCVEFSWTKVNPSIIKYVVAFEKDIMDHREKYSEVGIKDVKVEFGPSVRLPPHLEKAHRLACDMGTRDTHDPIPTSSFFQKYKPHAPAPQKSFDSGSKGNETLPLKASSETAGAKPVTPPIAPRRDREAQIKRITEEVEKAQAEIWDAKLREIVLQTKIDKLSGKNVSFAEYFVANLAKDVLHEQKEVQVERSKRHEAEDVASDMKKEIEKPLVVPALIELSQQTEDLSLGL